MTQIKLWTKHSKKIRKSYEVTFDSFFIQWFLLCFVTVLLPISRLHFPLFYSCYLQWFFYTPSYFTSIYSSTLYSCSIKFCSTSESKGNTMNLTQEENIQIFWFFCYFHLIICVVRLRSFLHSSFYHFLYCTRVTSINFSLHHFISL